MKPVLAYLGLGANVGDRIENLSRARVELERAGVRIVRASPVVETEPWGVADQPRFLNQVLEVEWVGTPEALLAVTQRVEAAVGRTPSYRWGPREIDIDILLFDELRVETPELVIPHPRLHEREFVLGPLRWLRPDIDILAR
jgi:2-amino-4-hydroxy-6-hydroxymethyldihydropteridine diphosphokinase